MASRQWGQWPERLYKELKETSGVVGIAGVALSAVGGIAAAPAILIGGAVVVGGALSWAVWRGFPPKLHRADDLLGRIVSLDELDSVHPPLRRFGMVGASSVGKSTLLDHLRVVPTKPRRTDEVHAIVIALQSNPPEHIALLDGAGQQYAQQFDIAKKSDIMTIFLDHDQGDKKVTTTRRRLEQHEEFLSQLEHYLDGMENVRFRHIHFILNKRDLWEKNPKKSELEAWFMGHVDHWRRGNLAETVTSAHHSNLDPNDIATLAMLFRQDI